MTDDRRKHRRVPGASLDWIEVARVKYGPEVKVVDLSRTGVLLESDRPLAPGSRQALEIAGPERSIVVPFGVLRSRISALAPQGAVYRSACSFTRPLELPELAAAAVSVPVAATVAMPVAAGHEATDAAVAPAKVESLMDSVIRESTTSEPAVLNGCQKIVARFLDGTILKGYQRRFRRQPAQFLAASDPGRRRGRRVGPADESEGGLLRARLRRQCRIPRAEDVHRPDPGPSHPRDLHRRRDESSGRHRAIARAASVSI